MKINQNQSCFCRKRWFVLHCTAVWSTYSGNSQIDYRPYFEHESEIWMKKPTPLIAEAIRFKRFDTEAKFYIILFIMINALIWCNFEKNWLGLSMLISDRINWIISKIAKPIFFQNYIKSKHLSWWIKWRKIWLWCNFEKNWRGYFWDNPIHLIRYQHGQAKPIFF